MKPYNKEVLKDAANRLLFDMEEEQYDVLLKDFDMMVEQAKLMSNVKGVDDLEPMVFPFEVYTSYLREDEPIKTLTPEEALKNATSKQEGQVKLPKVV